MSPEATGLLAPQPARVPLGIGRPRLRLVVSHGRVILDPRSTGGLRDLPALTIRLTRRGRLVIAMMTIGVAVILAVVLATSVDAAGPEIDHATTVLSGQTLSEVAAAQLPSLPINDAVARIQFANDMSTSQVHAGQSLLIPTTP